MKNKINEGNQIMNTVEMKFYYSINIRSKCRGGVPTIRQDTSGRPERRESQTSYPAR